MHKLITRIQHWRLAMVLALLVAAGGCAVNPVTGQAQLALIPKSQEIAIGEKQYEPAQQSQGGLYTVDPEVEKYVSAVGQRVAKHSDRQLPYQFVVLNNSVPNAWSLPGGKIAVNRGLLLALDNEAELAAVLGHEITHAAAKHGVIAMQRGMLLSGLVEAAQLSAQHSRYAGLTNTIVGGAKLGAQLITQKFSRTDEFQADHYGTIYMSRAGYNPEAAVTLQKKFVKLAKGNNQSWLDGLFASHPPSEARVKANEKTVSELPKGGILGRERYQKVMAYLRSKEPAYKDFDHAKILESHDQYPQAMADVNKAIAIEPKEPRFYGLRGDILAAEHHYKLATRQYNEAIDKDPHYFAYYLGRGLARAKLGEQTAAKTDLVRSNQLLPTAVASKELGQLSLAAGNTTLAKQYFQAAMNAQGAVGQAAGKAFVKLDLPDNPAKYVTAQPAMTSDGHLLAIVTNTTPYNVSQITVQFRVAAGGQTAQRSVTISHLGPNQRGSVASGWQFAPGTVQGADAAVTGASVD